MDQVDSSVINDIGSKVLDVHYIFGPHHLPGTDDVQDACLILRELGLKHLGRFLGRIGIASRVVLLQAAGLELFQDRPFLFLLDRLKGLETEVDGLGDLFLGEFVADVGVSLDDCEKLIVDFRRGARDI